MINVGKETRLTDELERQLMMQAIEDQFRFKPMVSFKKLIAKLLARDASRGAPVHTSVESAS